jgi:hypothetical protein
VGGTRTCALLAAAVATAAGVALAAEPAAAGRSSCTAPGSRTVFNSVNVRVYHRRDGAPEACWRPSGRRTRLDRGVDRFYAPRDARLGRARLAGEVLGYTWIDPGIPAVYVHSVNVRRGRYLRRTKIEPLVVFDPSSVAVTSLVVNGRGSLAWVQRVEGETSVWRFDRRGRRRLDTSSTSRITALRLLAGARLTWRKAGTRRTARLR